MRRNDREVTDPAEKLEILKECKVCRLALHREPAPYIVPMNFGFSLEDGRLTLYFHCAGEGLKLTLLGQNPNATFEMDCGGQLVQAPVPCGYGYRYASLMGSGTVRVLQSHQEKARALGAIMEHQAGFCPPFFPEQTQAVTVLALDVREWSAKRRA